jgi:4a-hydroxytetrahydrobiopterin dehydratase
MNPDPKSKAANTRLALSATQIVTNLATLEGWRLSGDDATVSIEKSFSFTSYHQTISFVNAVAFIAHKHDHHPELSVHIKRCVVRFSTHEPAGISMTDFECATQVDALLQ